MLRAEVARSVLQTDTSHHFAGMAKMTRGVEALEDKAARRGGLPPCVGGEGHADATYRDRSFLENIHALSAS